jgi:MFS family permease
LNKFAQNYPLKIVIPFLIKNKALRNKHFRNYIATRLTMITAMMMQTAIVSYLVYNLTKSELSLGLLGLWEVIPAVAGSLFAGHFVETREKRSVLLTCIIAYIGLSIFYCLLASDLVLQTVPKQTVVWLIYLGVFIGGSLRAFYGPANFSLFGLLIPRKQYPNATAWSSTSWQAGAVLGPLLGGICIGLMSYYYSLLSVIVFQLIGLYCMLKIPKQAIVKKTKEPILKSLKEGLHFVFTNQVLLAALSLDMFAVLFGGAVALLPVYADKILHVGEMGFGWLRAAPGIGAMITLLALSVIPLETKPGIKMYICIAGFGITTILFGLSTNFYFSLVLLMLGGICDAISVVIRGTILQLQTPDDMRGRISAVNTIFITSSNELGAMESGLTAKWMGTVPAVVFGGIMTLGVVAISYFKAPKLKTLDFKNTDTAS